MKGQINMGFWIAIILVLLVFLLLSTIQERGQQAINIQINDKTDVSPFFEKDSSVVSFGKNNFSNIIIFESVNDERNF
jgi:hypothetical protein